MSLLLSLFFLFQSYSWVAYEPLLEPVSNNAVAGWHKGDQTLIFSFMGIGGEKTYDAITRHAWVYDSRTQTWRQMPPVPGPVGRIAASATAVNGRVYLMGGYTVDAAGNEVSLGNVDVYTPTSDDPSRGYWSVGVPIPVPVDDAMIGVYDNRYILLISGWSQKDNIADAQVYDTLYNRWRKGTPIPGTPVFGHSGAISGRTIVYCAGAFRNAPGRKPAYLASDECWRGKIRSYNGRKIQWSKLPPHPGKANYRMAAGVWKEKIVFAGGTDNPYNYNGIGYNGITSEPVAATFAWNTKRSQWEILSDNPAPSMDHRGMVNDGEGLIIAGGMESGQKVTRRVSRLLMRTIKK